MSLGQNIRFYRERLRLSQEDLAKRLGYKDRSTIAKIENNVNDLTQSKIIAIAEALDTTPAALMGWEVPSSNATEHTQEVTNIPSNSSNDNIIVTGQTGLGKSNTIQNLYSQITDEVYNAENRKRVFISMAHQDTRNAEQIRKILESVKLDTDNNWVYMVGHDGSYRERQLDDMQFSALNAILDQMPDTTK